MRMGKTIGKLSCLILNVSKPGFPSTLETSLSMNCFFSQKDLIEGERPTMKVNITITWLGPGRKKGGSRISLSMYLSLLHDSRCNQTGNLMSLPP